MFLVIWFLIWFVLSLSLFFFLFFFFFSSRRRHTRCLSDRSSDVCSSDLPAGSRRVGGRLGAKWISGDTWFASVARCRLCFAVGRSRAQARRAWTTRLSRKPHSTR